MAFRLDPNPPDPTPHLHVTRLKAGGRFRGWILSAAIWGVWTHWTGRFSVPCQQNGTPCPRETHKLPQRWKGYLHVQDPDKEVSTLIELTPESAREVMAQASLTGNLRGCMIELQRGEKANNSRLIARLLIRHHNPDDLPAAVDPEPTLRHLWGMGNDGTRPNPDPPVQ